MWNLMPIGSISVPLNTVDLTNSFSTTCSKTSGVVLLIGFIYYIFYRMTDVGKISSHERYIEPYKSNTALQPQCDNIDMTHYYFEDSRSLYFVVGSEHRDYCAEYQNLTKARKLQIASSFIPMTNADSGE